MPRCALIGAVDFNAAHFLSQKFDLVIAVDKGLVSCQEIGCKPDVILGDFDSLGYIPRGKEVVRFPEEKDKSDMELALEGAVSGGCDQLVLYGALSGRIDHTLANIQLMLRCARTGLDVVGIGDEFATVVLEGNARNSLSFDAFDPATVDDGPYGRYISSFAYGGPAFGVDMRGLKYELEGATVTDDASLGLSNQFTGDAASISLTAGNLVVVFGLSALSSCGY